MNTLTKLIASKQLASSSTKKNLLLLAALAPFISFVPLALWAHRHPVDSLDVKIAREVQKDKGPVLSSIMLAISRIFGNALPLTIFSPFVGWFFWKAGKRLEGLMLATTCLSATTDWLILQAVVDRPRPTDKLVRVMYHEPGKSFPSDHVILTITFWGWLFVIGMNAWRRKRWWQKALLALPFLFIVLVGPSRVYVGDHWPSDVFGGYLFGTGWFALSLRLWLWLRNKKSRQLTINRDAIIWYAAIEKQGGST